MKIRKSDVYLLPLGLYIIIKILESSFYSVYVTGAVDIVSILCLLTLIAIESSGTKINIRSMVVLLAVLIMAVVAFRVRRTEAIILLAFVYVGRKLGFKRIAKNIAYLTFSMLTFIILSAYVGLIENYQDYRATGELRQYLGFLYALYGPAYFLNGAMLYCYAERERIKTFRALLLILIAFFFYETTNSRLSFYLTLIIVGGTLVYKVWSKKVQTKEKHKNGKIAPILWLSSIVFIVMAVFSIYVTATYSAGVPWKNQLNEILGYRLVYGQRALLRYGVNLLGQRIVWEGNGLNLFGEYVVDRSNFMYVDNLYLKLLLNYGVVFMVFFILLHTWAIIRALKRKNLWLVFFLCVLALRFSIDDLGFNIQYNGFWIVIGTLIDQRIIENKDRRQLV